MQPGRLPCAASSEYCYLVRVQRSTIVFEERRAMEQQEDTVIVPLTKGKETIIDAHFAADVLAFKWHAMVSRRTTYAARYGGLLQNHKRAHSRTS